jgi:hypothetical protein
LSAAKTPSQPLLGAAEQLSTNILNQDSPAGDRTSRLLKREQLTPPAHGLTAGPSVRGKPVAVPTFELEEDDMTTPERKRLQDIFDNSFLKGQTNTLRH